MGNFKPKINNFFPEYFNKETDKKIFLNAEEYEALRLRYDLGLKQAEAAEQMAISQTTFSRILISACEKITQALINGYAIIIESYEPTPQFEEFIPPEQYKPMGRRRFSQGRGRTQMNGQGRNQMNGRGRNPISGRRMGSFQGENAESMHTRRQGRGRDQLLNSDRIITPRRRFQYPPEEIIPQQSKFIGFACQKCGYQWSSDFDDQKNDSQMKCPECGSQDIYKLIKKKLPKK